MKPEQVSRWKEFAKAMCFGGWQNMTQARKERLWREMTFFIDEYKNEPVDGWDREYCLCDHFSSFFLDYEDHITDKSSEWWYVKENPRYFANQLRCVARASINAAVNDGVGVIGWTVGDLKEMFKGKIPKWLACQYDGCLSNTPDEAYIWL